ncbi:MAG: hypothetical protein JXJ22_05270 [Bacteroidales bacterium]|nr:hypothetical protein [Bacteroidales bacterium]
MKTVNVFWGILLSAMVMYSCDIKKSDISPEESFSKVYDHPDYNVAYYPLDVVEMPDDGFLILASLSEDTLVNNFLGGYLLKTDKTGEFEWELRIPYPYVSPVPNLLNINNSWHLLCMDAVTQENRLLEINTGNGTVNESGRHNLQFPLFAMVDHEKNILALNFDRVGKKSILTRYDQNLNPDWTYSYDIVDDVENQIRLHLNKMGKQFPFFIGEAGINESNPHYYVNCFKNYTMSLIFADVNNGHQTGILNTYQDDAAISSAVYLDSSNFALSRYYLEDNYIFSKVQLQMDEAQNANNFNDSRVPELASNAHVKTIIYEKDDGDKIIVYTSHTKTNTIVMYFYSYETGELINTKYLGSTNPIEVAALISSSEESLTILFRTLVIGRFPRIGLTKISKEELGI